MSIIDNLHLFSHQDVEVMDWPTKSPDMNPIEQIWDQMAIHIGDMFKPFTTQQQLRDAVVAALDALRPLHEQ